LLGATGIMGPMIETPFAMKKFKDAAKKVYGDDVNKIEWIINTETKTCHENIDEILDMGEGFLNTIAIGRVDLSSSLGLGRADINSNVMLDISREFAMKAKEHNLIVGVGGGMSLDTVPFLMKMRNLVDKFETRKVVFKFIDDEKLLDQGLILATEFEILYLQNKCDFYEHMSKEDGSRLEMLKKRLELDKEKVGKSK
jgi:hypothetical protein